MTSDINLAHVPRKRLAEINTKFGSNYEFCPSDLKISRKGPWPVTGSINLIFLTLEGLLDKAPSAVRVA